jgi:hypothetical protein
MHWTLLHARQRIRPRLRARLVKRSPRLEMLAIVSAGAFAGFAASALLLRAGLADMPWRYALSVCVAYAVLLALLRWWVVGRGARLVPTPPRSAPAWRPEARLARARRRAPSSREGEGRSWPDANPLDLLDLPDGPQPAPWTGAGGSSGGGGATVHLDGAAPVDVDGFPKASAGLAEVSPDAEAWPVLAAIALVGMLLAALGASAWMVWAAPDLLADLTFDGVIAAVLYRRLRRGPEPRGPLAGALARTWVPALLLLALVVGCALALEYAVPGATSIQDVLRAIRARWGA